MGLWAKVRSRVFEPCFLLGVGVMAKADAVGGSRAAQRDMQWLGAAALEAAVPPDTFVLRSVFTCSAAAFRFFLV